MMYKFVSFMVSNVICFFFFFNLFEDLILLLFRNLKSAAHDF